MTFALTLLSPLQPVVATLLSPSSICGLFPERHDPHRLRVARLVAETSRSTGVLRALARAIFSRRVLLHSSTFADLAYCVMGLTTLGAILGWAVVSTSWISDGVAAVLTRSLAPRRNGALPIGRSTRCARSRSFSLTNSASSSTTRSSTAFRAVGAAQGAPLGRIADAAGELPRSPARFADSRQQSRAVHRSDRRRGLIRA
jgi:hypothetical protein